MKSKRVNRKPRRRVRKTQKNKKINSSKELITYMAPRQMPFPPRYRCKFTTAIYGDITGAVASGQYAVNLNSIYQPFAGGSWAAALPAIGTLQPSGFSSMLNANFYRAFRVYGSKIVLEMLPQALTDTVEAVLTPSINGVAPANTATAMSQPYSKSCFFSSSKENNGKKGVLSNYITMHRLFGVSKRAIEDDLSGNYIGAYNADPAVLTQWFLTWATPDAVNISSHVQYRVIITHYCELFETAPGNFLIT